MIAKLTKKYKLKNTKYKVFCLHFNNHKQNNFIYFNNLIFIFKIILKINYIIHYKEK